jgi:CspA family cold shock protein
MVQGTVSFFNERGSYGFITIDEDEEDADDDDDVFFHMADLSGPDLAEGQEVEFEIEQSDKGPRASDLTRLGDAAVEEDENQNRSRDGDVVDEDGTRWVSINDM